MYAKRKVNIDIRPGRPAIFETPEELETAVNIYIKSCEDGKKPMSVAGLVRHLGFKSRQSLHDYCYRNKGNEIFADIIKRAKLRIEEDLNERLLDSDNRNVKSIIFILKNDFGWKTRGKINTQKKNNPKKQIKPTQTLDWEEWHSLYEQHKSKGLMS